MRSGAMQYLLLYEGPLGPLIRISMHTHLWNPTVTLYTENHTSETLISNQNALKHT